MIFSQMWWTEYYTGDDAFYISLNNDISKHDATSMLSAEGFWDAPNLRIQLMDPVEVFFRHTADNDGGEAREGDAAADRGKVTLTPSSVLSAGGNNARTALCGGFIRCAPSDPEGYGLTASSLVNHVNRVESHNLPAIFYLGPEVHAIGRCSQVVEGMADGSDIRYFTAQLACINLDKERCEIDNTMRMTPKGSKTPKDYHLCLLRNAKMISKGAPVRFKDRNGNIKEGTIFSPMYGCRHGTSVLNNVLAIQGNTPGSISAEGDSGALVVLSPEDDSSEELAVIGMLIGILVRVSNTTIELMIASRLSDVLQNMFPGGVDFADDRPAGRQLFNFYKADSSKNYVYLSALQFLNQLVHVFMQFILSSRNITVYWKLFATRYALV